MGMARTFQIPALFWNLTVLENLLIAEKSNPGESFLKSLLNRFWKDSERRAMEKASRILELLGLSGLWNQPTFKLSGGQMKLVEIGAASRQDLEMAASQYREAESNLAKLRQKLLLLGMATV